MSLRCALGMHKWKPAMRIRACEHQRSKYFNTADVRVALGWMALNYLITPNDAAAEIDWRFTQVGSRCTRCAKRKRP